MGYTGDWIIIEFPTHSSSLTNSFLKKVLISIQDNFAEIFHASQAVKSVTGDYIMDIYKPSVNPNNVWAFVICSCKELLLTLKLKRILNLS